MTEKVEVNCPLCDFKCRKDHIGRHLCRSNHISQIVGLLTPDEYNKQSEHPFIFKRDSEKSIDFAVCIVCFKSFFNDGKTKEEKNDKYENFERLHKNSKFNCFDLTKISTQREKFKKFIPVPKENRILSLLVEEPKEEPKEEVKEQPKEEVKEQPKEEPKEDVKEDVKEDNKIELVYNTLESESQNDEEIEYLINEYKKLKSAAFEREKELCDVVEHLEEQIVDGRTLSIVDSICYGELEEEMNMDINEKIKFLISLFRTYKKENISLNKRVQYLETILEDD